MSETHNGTAHEQQSNGGRHRGHASPSEESEGSTQGRHRRPGGNAGQEG